MITIIVIKIKIKTEKLNMILFYRNRDELDRCNKFDKYWGDEGENKIIFLVFLCF